MNLKIEQIKQLAAKKSYKEAAAIAKEMSWHKVKDWNALATVINVQEAVGDTRKREIWLFLHITVILEAESLYTNLLRL